MIRKILVTAALFANFTAATAFAQTGFQLIPDRRVTIGSVSDGDTISFRGNSGASYCCEIVAAVGGVNTFLNTTSVTMTDASGTSTLTGRFAAEAPQTSNGQARVCFIVPRSADTPQFTLTVGVSGGPSINPVAECRETTLYGGFNTSVTDFNFLEITNTLDSTSALAASRDLSCTVTALNTVPDPDTVAINEQSVTVSAGSRTDVDVHTAAGAGAFGPVILACNGAPGAIKAVVNQYNVTSLSPLDFAPVAQDVLQTRAALAGPGGS